MNSSRKFYESFAWSVIENALLDLVDNQDIIENTKKEYIVGYLLKCLIENGCLSEQCLTS